MFPGGVGRWHASRNCTKVKSRPGASLALSLPRRSFTAHFSRLPEGDADAPNVERVDRGNSSEDRAPACATSSPARSSIIDDWFLCFRYPRAGVEHGPNSYILVCVVEE